MLNKSKIKKLIRNFQNKRYPLTIYEPIKKNTPEKMIQIPSSAWQGLELIVEDILDHFEVGRDSCIEFGVQFGYSTVVFSNYFKNVKGIDTFIGDTHSRHTADHYDQTKNSLSKFENIELFKANYQDWIKQDNEQYDFAHIDIVHKYKETYECGLWAAQHSKCCIFHDTESFPAVRKAVHDIAKHTEKKVYNYPYHNGLGIII